ncbi:hypothetical protein [Parapedobacter lycopersici]|uniref:hypothetical protein n=1 Tax=Parapedobacter lycopersici TaxID=1864939 RepID=UPI00333FCF65
MEKCCLDCQQPIVGRADKKFCDDACRSNYNNRMRSRETAYFRKINHILKKNRNILKVLNPEGKARVGTGAMRALGFDFKYITEIYTTRQGSQYRFCYEYGYLLLEDSRVLLVRRDVPLT